MTKKTPAFHGLLALGAVTLFVLLSADVAQAKEVGGEPPSCRQACQCSCDVQAR